MSKVDVIIPIYGRPVYFAETIQSVLNQPNIGNIILVLDRVDIDYFTSLNINLEKCMIIVSENPGIVSALNIGLENSKSEFIARIDSDDIMFPDRIVKQLDFLVANPEYACIGSSIEIFGNRINNKIKKYPVINSKIIKHLSYQNSIAHPSVMYRRKSVLDVGGYRAIFEGSEDYDLWFRLSKIGKLYNLKEPLTKYRINAGQYSSKFSTYRAELDSLVRLFNLANIDNVPKEFFYKSVSSEKIKEYLKIYTEKIRIDQPKLFKKLRSAQKLGDIINIKSSKNVNFQRKYVVFFLTAKLITTSPIFSLKIFLGKVHK